VVLLFVVVVVVVVVIVIDGDMKEKNLMVEAEFILSYLAYFHHEGTSIFP
jgi:hypothetical protein